MKKIISLAVLPLLLAACADKGAMTPAEYGSYGSDSFTEESLTDASYTTDAYITAAAPKYYIGSAYKVEDIQYVPMEDMSYNQTGVAGIVPSELNGSLTSNGETFNANQMMATHKTLPLPTIAKVTNLDNGSSVVVRINNRGPFVNSRLIDLSPAAASKLGITNTAKVQVQVMTDQTTAVKNATLGTTPVEPAATPAESAPTTGPYSVQAGAFYSEDNANALANRLTSYGNASVVKEADMFKVRINNLDATTARSVIDSLRSSENSAPGLLKDGKWVNPDSI